jgi:hypothetical protein
MRAKTILALSLFLAVQTAAQDAPKRPTQAQCKFSDGETITVTSPSGWTKALKLAIDGSLITVAWRRDGQAINLGAVPMGEYIIVPREDSDNWILMMANLDGQLGQFDREFRLSVTTSTLPVGKFPVSFDQTGETCMMHWNLEQSEVLLSLEFVRDPSLGRLQDGVTVAQANADNGALQRRTLAQCKFPDGAMITVTYSSEQTKALRMTTDGPLITIKGISVPMGKYTVSPAKDSQNNWTLTMRKQTRSGEPSALPPLPMSVATSTPHVGNFPVSFDQTGGSCMMHWSQEKSDILLSLEFVEMNADLPVLFRK